MTVESYLKEKHLSYTTANRPSGLNYIMDCPFCNEPVKSFAINAETGAYNCMRINHCGAKGSFNDLRAFFGDDKVVLDSQVKFSTQKKNYIRPDRSKIGVTKVTAPVLDWLHSRKISDKTISKFKIREGRLGWVVFPYFKDGELFNIKQRNIKNKQFINTKGKEPSLFNRDNIKPNALGEWELTIVEGEMDCLAMDTYGIPAVSVPDGATSMNWIELEWEWLEKFTRINLALDMDMAGGKGKISLNQRLGEDRCYEVKLPYKDVNECLMKGVSAEEINKCIDNAKPFPIEGIAGAEEYLDEILYGIDHPEESIGIETPFTNLTNIIKGFRMGEVTVIAGSNHSGKSTYMGQVVNFLAYKGYKSCIASLEMKPAKTLEWMIKQNSWKGHLTKEIVKKYLKEDIAGKLYMLEDLRTITPEYLLKAWSLAAKRYRPNFFILDPFSMITYGDKNEYKGQTKFMTDLVAFSHKWKCHVFVIAHVRKPDKDNYTSGKVDIAGSANITNFAHNVLMIKRLESDESEEIQKEVKKIKGYEIDQPSTRIAIKKCREVGKMGKFYLRFNPETKLFSEVKHY